MNLKPFRELFIFTRREKNGIIILLCLIFGLIGVDLAMPFYFRNHKMDITSWEKEAGEIALVQKKDTTELAPVAFNPNEADAEKLRRAGISAYVASNWLKYLAKGGKFRKKEDILKIYGMTLEMFTHLKDYLLLPSTSPEKIKIEKPFISNFKSYTEQKPLPVKKEYRILNLNRADSAELENLPGLGPVLSSRIIRYRELLGGFYSLGQLHEVYGIREENLLPAMAYLKVEEDGLRKFNLNFSTLTELGHHPYIGYRAARKIVYLRDHSGRIASINQLASVMGEDSLKKLQPYLEFGP